MITNCDIISVSFFYILQENYGKLIVFFKCIKSLMLIDQGIEFFYKSGMPFANT